VVGEHGSRHAGQAVTVDSLCAAGAPPRLPTVPFGGSAGAAVGEVGDVTGVGAGSPPPAPVPWPWPYESEGKRSIALR
jgi:hypothetical protein